MLRFEYGFDKELRSNQLTVVKQEINPNTEEDEVVMIPDKAI